MKKQVIIISILIFVQIIMISFSMGYLINPLIYRNYNSSINIINSMENDIIKYNIPVGSTFIIGTHTEFNTEMNNTMFYYYNRYELYPSIKTISFTTFLNLLNAKTSENLTELSKYNIDYMIYRKKKGSIYNHVEIYKITKDSKNLVYKYDSDIKSLYNEYKNKNKLKQFYKKYKYIKDQYNIYKDKNSKEIVEEFDGSKVL